MQNINKAFSYDLAPTNVISKSELTIIFLSLYGMPLNPS